ncbi:MAG: YkgJ family cysteine cluster protein [Chloroflexota bacterium]
MKSSHKITFFEANEELSQIYDEIEHRVSEAQTNKPIWPCQKGCDACCRRLAHVPEVTAVEWQQMQVGIQNLSPAIQAQFLEKISALKNHQEGFVTCPLLDEEAGACLIYEHRPAACRMYGFYVSRYNNQWCQDIEDLFQAGELEGVTFGNFAAMTRHIQEQFGERQSIIAWAESIS